MPLQQSLVISTMAPYPVHPPYRQSTGRDPSVHSPRQREAYNDKIRAKGQGWGVSLSHKIDTDCIWTIHLPVYVFSQYHSLSR